MSFGGLQFTNRGLALQAKGQAGTLIQFTKIAVGDGYLGGSTIPELTSLKNLVKNLSINKLTVIGNGQAVVGAPLSNQGLGTGFYWREIGVFANDPDVGEILYCYGNAGANAEWIPAGGGPDILEKQVDVISIVGNAQNVSAVINQSLVFATQADMTALTTKVSNIETQPYSTERLSKDANGIFTDIRLKRSDGTLMQKSVLSSGTSPKYTKRTVTFYAANGTTVTGTKVYTLTYTGDDLTSEVVTP